MRNHLSAMAATVVNLSHANGETPILDKDDHLVVKRGGTNVAEG